MFNEFQKSRANVNVTTGEFALSEEAIQATIHQNEIEKSVETHKLMKTITVPTNDGIVRNRLRFLKLPITLYGENVAARRDRLKSIMAEMMADGKKIDFVDPSASVELDTAADYATNSKVYYTAGKPILKKVRREIMDFSIRSAKTRTEKLKSRFSLEAKQRKKALFASVASFQSQRSEVGANRALSCVDVSPDGTSLAIGSWNGEVSIWPLAAAVGESSSGEISVAKFRHGARVTDVKFLGSSAGGSGFSLISAGCDGAIKLWQEGCQKEIRTMKGHKSRLSKLALLPTNRSLALATSFDKTWSLWDLETGASVLTQVGHLAEVYAVAVHPDSSICLTGDLSGIARLWDLRSGQAILNLRGHVRQLLSADFAPNGFQAATGAGDNTVKIWDLRKKSLLYTIAAHFKDVSSVQFQKDDGNILMTSSFDKTVRLWSGHTFRLVKTLVGHEDKVSGSVFSPADDSIFSVSFDRTWKKWRRREE